MYKMLSIVEANRRAPADSDWSWTPEPEWAPPLRLGFPGSLVDEYIVAQLQESIGRRSISGCWLSSALRLGLMVLYVGRLGLGEQPRPKLTCQ